jgi:CBS domain-containing protein
MRYGRDFRNRHPRDDDFGFLYYRAEQRFGPWDSGGGYDFQGGYGDRARADYPEGGGWAWPEFGRFDTMGGGGMGRDASGADEQGGLYGEVGYGDWDVEGSRFGAPSDFGGFGEQGGWGRGGAGRSPRAADIMTENPEAVTPETSLVEVARRMRDLDVGIIPVVDDLSEYRLQGVITDRDIAVRAAAEGKDPAKATVRDHMTRDVATVNEGSEMREVFSVMKREQVRRVPVTDREGRLVGIIAQADLAVDYAGLDLQREREVEEVIERVSEPARPRWERQGRYMAAGPRHDRWARDDYDRDLADRLRGGWRTLKREARQLWNRGYDRGWR